MAKQKQWAVRVVLRDGSRRLIGPFHSKEAAAASAQSGPHIISARVTAVSGYTGIPRLLSAKPAPLAGGAPLPEPPTEIIVTLVDSPSINTLRVQGSGFTLADVLQVQSDDPGFWYWGNPDGTQPNTQGSNGPGVTVDWSDTEIIIYDPNTFAIGIESFPDRLWTEIQFYDTVEVIETYTGPDLPLTIALPSGAVPTLTNATNDGGPVTDIYGTDLDQLDSFVTHHNSYGTFTITRTGSSPYPGLGWVDVDDTHIQITGGVVSAVGFDGHGTYDGGTQDTNTIVVQAAQVVLPTMTAASSPDTDVIRLEGTDLDQLSIAAPYFTNSQAVAWANPAVNPNAASANTNNGNTILTWTATVIEVQNAFHDGKTVSYFEGYLLGSGTPDVTFDCPDFPVNSGGSPVITNVTQDPGEDVVVTGMNLDQMEAVHFLPQGGFITNVNSSYTLVSPTEVRLGLAVMGTRPFTITHMNPTTIANPGTSAVGAWDGTCLVEDVGSGPNIDSASSPVATRVHLEGTDFSSLNHIELIGTFNNYSYFDPNGPDAGSNPATAGMRSDWSTDVIEFDDTQLGGETITAVHLYAAGDNPDYGIQDIPDFSLDSAPVVTGGESNAPFGMTLQGTGFDWVDQIRYDNNITDLYYYDPNGPRAGSNPGTATINTWSDTLIDITDTARGNFHISGNGSGPTGGRVLMEATPANSKNWNPPGGGQWTFPDYFVQDQSLSPVAQGVSSPEVDGIRIDGQNMDLVTRVRLYWDNNNQSTFIDPLYTEQTTGHITIGQAYGMGLAGQTVSRVELWEGSFPGTLASTLDNLAILIQSGAPATPVIENVTIPENSGELHLLGQNLDPQGVDFTTLALYTAGTFQVFDITEPFVLSVSDTEIVIDQAGYESFTGSPSQAGFYTVQWRDSQNATIYNVDLPGDLAGMQVGTGVVVSSDGISFRTIGSPSAGILRVQGWGMNLVQSLKVYWDNDNQNATDTPPFSNPPDNGYIDTPAAPSGETVSRIEFRNGSNQGPTATGLSTTIQ